MGGIPQQAISGNCQPRNSFLSGRFLSGASLLRKEERLPSKVQSLCQLRWPPIGSELPWLWVLLPLPLTH